MKTKPHVALSKQYNFGQRTTQGWVREARARQLLTPAVGTKPGGELTAKARDLLARREPVPVIEENI